MNAGVWLALNRQVDYGGFPDLGHNYREVNRTVIAGLNVERKFIQARLATLNEHAAAVDFGRDSGSRPLGGSFLDVEVGRGQHLVKTGCAYRMLSTFSADNEALKWQNPVDVIDRARA